MTAYRVCPRPACAELNAADAFYCHACSSPLVPNIKEQTRPRCEFCGRKITNGARRCREHKNLPDPYEAVA